MDLYDQISLIDYITNALQLLPKHSGEARVNGECKSYYSTCASGIGVQVVVMGAQWLRLWAQKVVSSSSGFTKLPRWIFEHSPLAFSTPRAPNKMGC